jgi:small-conductance mechanosensitive channel
MMIHRATIIFFFAAFLQSALFALHAQSVPEAEEDNTDPAKTESAAEDAHRLPFDPALIGLPDFPETLASPKDYAKAQALIESRLAKLDQHETKGKPDKTRDTQEEGPADEPGEDQQSGQASGIVPFLQELLLAVKQGAVLVARQQDVGDSLADEKDQLDKLQSQGLERKPPYPLAMLDQLRSDLGMANHTAEVNDQRRAQVQEQVDKSAKELAAVMSKRRSLRDRVAEADDAVTRRSLEMSLETARIDTLVALQRHDNALAQQGLTRQEHALTTAQSAVLERKIALAQGDVVFTHEALTSRLAEVQTREDALLAKINTLTGSVETAETALFQARQHLQNGEKSTSRNILEARVRAREAELLTARKGLEYRGRVKSFAKTARIALNRRYSLWQGADQKQWPTWLRDAQVTLREIGKDRDFTLSDLSSLQSLQLALSNRLATPDLDPGVRKAVQQRMAAIQVQSQLAEAILLAQDQERSLVQRLLLDLEPRVRERSLDQWLDQARDQLAKWWDSEIAIVQDNGIHVRDVVTVFVVFILVYFVVWLLQLFLRRSLLPKLAAGDMPGEGGEQTGPERQTLRVLVSPLIRNTSRLFVLLVALYAAMTVSGLGRGAVQEWLWTLLVLALYLQIGIWATASMVDLFKRKRDRKERDDPSAVTGYGLLLFFIRVGIWVMVGVSILSYFHYPVTGLIGALGIGGIAVAFAVQNILSDVFNSMAISLDKPFRVGDFIVAGEIVGVIENIGVKTTRIKSLPGELVVMSNTNLLGSCIHNYKHMRERRVVFKIRVVYETPAEKIERIPRIIADIIRAQARARFDRAHFFEYGDFSLVFEVVYYIYGADYVVYMDTQQAINLAIYHRFQEEGISFAYPTQELILRQAPEAAGLA